MKQLSINTPKRMKNSIMFILAVFISACSTKNDDVDLISIDVTSENGIDNFFESYYSISLETKDECLISDIKKIIISNEKLYILDEKQPQIFIFDKNGYYLNKIDKKGEGPTEYYDIADFFVFDSSICLLSRIGRKILVYSDNIEFIKSYSLSDFYDYFYPVNGNVFLYANYSNDTHYNISVYNFGEQTISYKFLPFKNNQSFLFPPTPFNITFKGDLFVTQQYDYNIYKLNVNSIETIYRFDFNTKDRLPGEIQKIDFNKMYQDLAMKSVVQRIEYINQTDEYLYIVYTLDHLKRISKIEKSTKNNSSLKLEYNNNFPFVFSHVLGFNENYMIGYLHAESVLIFDDKFSSDKNKDELLEAEDNPVLFFHKLN
jgi:hypothetical protein